MTPGTSTAALPSLARRFGAFVAEQPGSYVITATGGDRAAAASVVVTPRNVQRALEVVGRTPPEEFQTLEQWIVGNYAYVTAAMAGRLWVYDISNPAAPVKVRVGARWRTPAKSKGAKISAK